MSYADKVFIDMCNDIIDNGYSTEGEKVRPKWDDGSYAYTIKKFGVVNRYDLSREFPIMTLRRTAFKSCIDEILWIWQKKSNNIRILTAIYGMNGPTRTAQSAKRTDISLASGTSIRKE